jgi:hypothetical protein
VVDGGGSATILALYGNHTFASVLLRNGGVLTSPDTTTTQEYALNLNVSGAVEIDATSRIDVSERGYLGGYRGGLSNEGRTYGNMPGAYLNAGGSYGGMGSLSNNNSWGPARVSGVYGDYRNPEELGSGGSGVNSSWPGGDGGGLVRLTAGSLRVDGAILADGGGDGSGSYQHNGGGSGGGINMSVGTLEGTGVIRANGGRTYSGNSADAGGGGGRIAIYYANASSYDFAKVTAYGGTGNGGTSGSTIGGAGTVYLEKAGVQLSGIGSLVVNNGGLRGQYPTPIVAVPAGSISSLDLATHRLGDLAANFPLDNRAAGTIGLHGLWVQPDITRKFYYPVIENDAKSLTVIDWDGSFGSVASVGDSYQGATIVNNVHVTGNAIVTTTGRLVIVGGQLVEDFGGDWNGPVDYVEQLNQDPSPVVSITTDAGAVSDGEDGVFASGYSLKTLGLINEAAFTADSFLSSRSMFFRQYPLVPVERPFLNEDRALIFWPDCMQIEPTISGGTSFFLMKAGRVDGSAETVFRGEIDDVVIANRIVGERNPPPSPAGRTDA